MTSTEPSLSSPESLDSQLRATYQQAASGGSTADQVHRSLTLAIENGVLAAGTRLAEESLAQAFQVSRTPVREALVRLEAERVVERDRHGSLLVSRLGVDQIIELYVVREALDGAAARLAATHADALDLHQLKHINDQMAESARNEDYATMARLNVEFHAVMARASKNLMLETFVDQIHRFVRRFRTTTFSHLGRAMVAVDEHQVILDALQARDANAAETAARNHMRQALDVRIVMEASRDADW